MAYYSVFICGRKRKTRFKGSKKTVYKKLHLRGYNYNRNTKCWQKTTEKLNVKLPMQNVKLLLSIGDYKHTEFDIIIKRVFSAEQFKNLVERSSNITDAHNRIRDETIDMAAASLRNNGHFGLAKMLKNNSSVDYVVGGEYVWTDEQPADAEFTRFQIRGEDRLLEIASKRRVPHEYGSSGKEQKKLKKD